MALAGDICCISNSAEETRQIAALVAARSRGGMFIGLSGPLGAGKTEFVRGFAEALGAGEEISSPSFVLEAIYSLPLQSSISALHHWDLYRLNAESLCEDLLDLAGDLRKIVLVEWCEKVPLVADLLSFHVVLGFADRQTGKLDLGACLGEERSESREIIIRGLKDSALRQALGCFAFKTEAVCQGE